MATFSSLSLSITAFNFFSGFHTMGGEHAMEHFDVCIGPNLTCMNDLLNRMGQFDHVEYNGEKVCGIILRRLEVYGHMVHPFTNYFLI